MEKNFYWNPKIKNYFCNFFLNQFLFLKEERKKNTKKK